MRRKKSSLEEMAPNVGSPIGEFREEYVVKPVFDADGVQASSGIGVDGKEYPDPVPMSVPVGSEAPIPLMELLDLLVKRRVEPENDFGIDETEEEANDFEVEDDPLDPATEYEKVFMPKDVVVSGVVAAKAEVPVVASSSEPAKPAVVKET